MPRRPPDAGPPVTRGLQRDRGRGHRRGIHPRIEDLGRRQRPRQNAGGHQIVRGSLLRPANHVVEGDEARIVRVNQPAAWANRAGVSPAPPMSMAPAFKASSSGGPAGKVAQRMS